MLKLKSTFHLYEDKMDEILRKSITDKFIEQAAKCILTDITENRKQADKHENGEEGVDELC